MTPQQIADEHAAEKRRKEVEAAEKKREAEEHKAAELKKLEEKKEAARLQAEQKKRREQERKEEEVRKAAERKQKEEERRVAAARKKEEEAASRNEESDKRKEAARLRKEGQTRPIEEEQTREAAETAAKLDKERQGVERRLRTISDDPKHTPGSQLMAAVVMGQSNSPPTDKAFKVTAAEREIAAQIAQQTIPTRRASETADDWLRKTMNDQTQNLAARQIAAIALGVDPNTVRPSKRDVTAGNTSPEMTSAQLYLLRENAAVLLPALAPKNQAQGTRPVTGAPQLSIAPPTDSSLAQEPSPPPQSLSTFPGPVEIGKLADRPASTSPASSFVKQDNDPFHPNQQQIEASEAKKRADEDKLRQQAARENWRREIETTETCGQWWNVWNSFRPFNKCSTSGGGAAIPDGQFCRMCTRERACKGTCASWSQLTCNQVCRPSSYSPPKSRVETFTDMPL